ncbi:MAG: hypothetical protein IJS62_07020 [Bacteroidales bacterium]|nr:hypothetical protein [Bacteroidales bacterium]
MTPVFLFLLLGWALSSVPDDTSLPPEVHPRAGVTRLRLDSLGVTFIARKNAYRGGPAESADADILSPKSVNVSPDGSKFYVNSLEGMRTVVYDAQSGGKRKVIRHRFDTAHVALWAPPSGFFPFRHERLHPDFFSGKPVESCFSHEGACLWVPYYRRDYDKNAVEPSAMAVIDTRRDTIVRLFETGPLPKMVACSPDGKTIAVTHWGDNTVGLIDISAPDMADWHFRACVVVDYRLPLDFPADQAVNRDIGSGYCLRGTLFSPDGKYLFVSCMGRGGGIAVIDLAQGRYLGRLTGMMSNIRHLILSRGRVYLTINGKGYVQSLSMAALEEAAEGLRASGKTVFPTQGWKSCKVPAGARTLVASPDGRYLFVACNHDSKIAVVDARSMRMLGAVDADSYPVGLAISPDGRRLYATSQGRGGRGGNAVDIFRIDYR